MDYLIEPSFVSRDSKTYRSFEQTILEAVRCKDNIKVGLDTLISYPNILANPNFKNPINTSEKSIFTSVAVESTGYYKETTCIDCWKFNSYQIAGMQDGDCTLELTNKGIKLSYVNNTDRCFGNWLLSQKIHDPKRYRGNSLTLSLKYKDVTDESINKMCAKIALVDKDYVYIEGIEQPQEFFTGTEGVLVLTTSIPEDYDGEIYIVITLGETTTEQVSATLEWIKLENIPVSTSYRVRSYEEEVNICDRYTKIEGITISGTVHAK